MPSDTAPPIAELIGDDHGWISLRRSRRVCEFFNTHGILFNHDDMVADAHYPVVIGKQGRIEQWSMRSGNVASGLGAFSYIYSEILHPGFQAGRYCSIGGGLVLFAERHPLESVTTSNVTYARSPLFMRAHREVLGDRWPWGDPPRQGEFPILGHDVWIGQNVTLARDIRIGTGAIVGAGAMVTKDVAPYTIVAGNPARPIRPRFPPELAGRLLASRWWEAHPDCLFRFDRNDPARFLDQLDEARAAGTIAQWDVRGFSWDEMLREIAALAE